MTKAENIFEKIARRGIDSNLQKLPSFTYPDGDHPEWYDPEDTALANTPNDPPLFSRKRPKLPKGPKSPGGHITYGPNNVAYIDGVNPATFFATNRPKFPKGPESPGSSHLSYGPDNIALVDGRDPNQPLFAAKRPTLPKGPSSPSSGRITYDDDMIASVKGAPKPGQPGSDEKSLNYWLADYSLRQERGLHNPELRPLAFHRQTLKDKGFVLPNAKTGWTGKQTKKERGAKSADEKAVEKYTKKVKKIMSRVGIT